jgi:hypothetical protein
VDDGFGRDLWILLRVATSTAGWTLPAAERRRDWRLWMHEQARDADYVLVVEHDSAGLAPLPRHD